MSCDFHGSEECMANGAVGIVQLVTDDLGTQVLLRARCCTDSALYAWLERHGQAIPGARPGDLRAKRPGDRVHRDQRPTVAQRRPRRNLMGGEP